MEKATIYWIVTEKARELRHQQFHVVKAQLEKTLYSLFIKIDGIEKYLLHVAIPHEFNKEITMYSSDIHEAARVDRSPLRRGIFLGTMELEEKLRVVMLHNHSQEHAYFLISNKEEPYIHEALEKVAAESFHEWEKVVFNIDQYIIPTQNIYK